MSDQTAERRKRAELLDKYRELSRQREQEREQKRKQTSEKEAKQRMDAVTTTAIPPKESPVTLTEIQKPTPSRQAKEKRYYRAEEPRLVFDAMAWLKYQWLCHAGNTEIGGFGLAADDTKLLRVTDILMLRQRAGVAHVDFTDEAVADLFDDMVDQGYQPRQFGRIWLHTHPGASVTPSSKDEETFARAFGSCDWAVMGILGRTGQLSARLRFNAGPGGSIDLPYFVDWSSLSHINPVFLAEQMEKWQREYHELVENEDSWYYDRPRQSALYDREGDPTVQAVFGDYVAPNATSTRSRWDLELEEEMRLREEEQHRYWEEELTMQEQAEAQEAESYRLWAEDLKLEAKSTYDSRDELLSQIPPFEDK